MKTLNELMSDHDYKVLADYLNLTLEETEDLASKLKTENDFELNLGNREFRIINKSSIDDILISELRKDPYVLGCFNSNFLGDCTGIPYQLIEIIQKAEGFEELGDYISTNQGWLETIAANYASLDGYGHHFNPYDGSEEEFTFDKIDFYIFRTN